MTGNKALIDSNIIIYLSKREVPLSFLDQFDDISISVITYMEILGFPFPDQNEEKFIRDLKQFLILFMLIKRLQILWSTYARRKKLNYQMR